MDLNEVVRMYNEEKLSLSAIGERMERSKSSVSKALIKAGYVRNKLTERYEKPQEQLNIDTNIASETNVEGNNGNNETNVSRETIKNNNNETNVSRETIEMVNRTYAISNKIDKAMKIKSAVEGKKPIDIVREALEAYIEQKYFDM
jgi:predicted DNA-binding protein YlxM (UPF0122 family)/predicted DNA-binding protein